MLLFNDNIKSFGLLVLGVCPGGLASNFWTLLLDGDVNLSITMTFISSIAAMGNIRINLKTFYKKNIYLKITIKIFFYINLITLQCTIKASFRSIHYYSML